MLVTIIFLLIIITSGVYCKNNKFLNTLLIFAMFIMFAFERSNQDYISYLKVYEDVGYGNVFELLGYEESFLLFCSVGNELNLSFDAARAIVCIFEILALVSSIIVFSEKIAFVLALFLIFPATFDAELFRWLSGMCLIIFAFPYIIRAENKWDYITYATIVGFATLLHTSCILFSLFFLLGIKQRGKLILIIAAGISIIFITSQTTLLNKVLEFMPIDESLNEKYKQTGHSNIFGLMAITIRELPILIIGYLSHTYSQKMSICIPSLDHKYIIFRNKYSQNEMGEILCSKILNMNIISILLLALAVYSPQIQRLFHVLLFYNLISIAYLCEEKIDYNLVTKTVFCCVLVLLFHLINGQQNVDIFLSHFNEGFLINLYNWISVII